MIHVPTGMTRTIIIIGKFQNLTDIYSNLQPQIWHGILLPSGQSWTTIILAYLASPTSRLQSVPSALKASAYPPLRTGPEIIAEGIRSRRCEAGTTVRTALEHLLPAVLSKGC